MLSFGPPDRPGEKNVINSGQVFRLIGERGFMAPRISQIAVLFSALPAILLGQSYTASVRGIVTDASNAAVPAARVTVTSVERNTSQAALTDNAGRYVITSLPPGHYTLSAEAQGFNKYMQNPFELQVQQEATVD